MDEKLYDEKGFQITGFNEFPTIPVNTSGLSEALLKGSSNGDPMTLTAEQIYQNVSEVAEKMNSVSHIFCNRDSAPNGTVLTANQRITATNMMFHLARHEYAYALKEFLSCVKDGGDKALNYNEGILFSILADAFENTMTYRKHRFPDEFALTVTDLTRIREGDTISTEKLDTFVDRFDREVEPFKNADPFYLKGREALLKGLVSSLIDNGMQPKHEKTLRQVEAILMDMEHALIKEEDTIKEMLNNYSKKASTAVTWFNVAYLCPEKTLRLVVLRLLIDIRCVILEYDPS